MLERPVVKVEEAKDDVLNIANLMTIPRDSIDDLPEDVYDNAVDSKISSYLDFLELDLEEMFDSQNDIKPEQVKSALTNCYMIRLLRNLK